MPKFGEVIEIDSPWEPDWPRIAHIFKLIQIMVPEGHGGGHKRGNYFYT
jgi:hypothetical protein